MLETSKQIASTAAERYLLVYMIVVLVVISALVISFFVVFLRRKNKLIQEKLQAQQRFEAEIIKAQTEAQEQTLKNIGWELHDNVGQLLSYASMQLSIVKMQVDNEVKGLFKDTSEAISESLSEVRALSRSLNNDVILNVGLKKSITNELNRLKKLKFSTAELQVLGSYVALENRKHEIVIFRIIQEFLSNSVKYSEAKNLKISLNYQDKILIVKAEDDGKGFEMKTVERGAGLINMKSRAELINANLDIVSSPGEGVKLTIEYPLNQKSDLV